MKKLLFIALALFCSFVIVLGAFLVACDDMLLFSSTHLRFARYFIGLEYGFYRFMMNLSLIPYIELVIIAIFSLAYALPSFIAIARNHEKQGIILLVNIFFGWTIVGWFFVLVWSLKNDFIAKITHLKENII